MEIHYCAKCGARIAPEDVAAGRATTSDQFNFLCEPCSKQAGNTPVAQSTPTGNRRQSGRFTPSSSGLRRPGAQRAASTSRQRAVGEQETNGGARRPLSLPLVGAGVVGFCLLLGLVAYLLGGGSGSRSHTRTTGDERGNRATARPALPDPPGSAKPLLPPSPPPPPVAAGADREEQAQKAFATLIAFEGLAADDRAGRVARLEQFLERYGQSLAAPRARVMLDQFRKSDNGIRDQTIPVQVGRTIERTFAQLAADQHAYAPKQSYDAGTRETQVYLPYGSDRTLYFGECRGLLMEDARPGHVAELRTPDSNTAGQLTYKLQFDRPIGSFRVRFGGQVELHLDPTCVAGLEYSTDGAQWKPVHEYTGKEITEYKIFGPFIGSAAVEGLKTQTLYLRIYIRDAVNPEARDGKRMWLKVCLAGDPGWGDAATTFFVHQPQIWVKEAR